MNFKVSILSTCFISLLVFQSCKKGYLDENPDNRTEINTLDKVAQLTKASYAATTPAAITGRPSPF